MVTDEELKELKHKKKWLKVSGYTWGSLRELEGYITKINKNSVAIDNTLIDKCGLTIEKEMLINPYKRDC